MRQQHQLYLSLRSILTAQSDLQGLKQPELKRQKESAKHDRLYGNPEEKSIPIIFRLFIYYREKFIRKWLWAHN